MSWGIALMPCFAGSKSNTEVDVPRLTIYTSNHTNTGEVPARAWSHNPAPSPEAFMIEAENNLRFAIGRTTLTGLSKALTSN